MKMATVVGHRLVVPDNVADWDAVAGFSTWEKERMDSILTTMQHGDVLYDIGAEHGWMTAIFARKVGGENMVVVEPSPEFWPNIRMCFEENAIGPPLGAVEAFCGAELQRHLDIHVYGWPPSAQGPECDAMAYRSPVHHDWLIPTVTIDHLSKMTGKPPKGITIDVEGAELLVLQGATHTLTNDRPLVWVSIHPDLMLRDFDTPADLVQRWMQDHDYEGRLLAIDHEEHHVFWPKERDPL